MNHKKLLLTLTLCLCALLCTVVTASADEPHANHYSCGVVNCQNNDHGHTPVTEWKPWTGPQSASEDNIPYDSNTKTAYIYLANNVEIEDALTIPQGYTLYLCLNGHSITKTSEDGTFGGAIVVIEGGKLVLCDCKPSGNEGSITHSPGIEGRGVRVGGSTHGAETVFLMYGGKISGNHVGDDHVGDDGAGVQIQNATFKMYGGEISDNHVEKAGNYGGGGVNVYSYGTFTMYGGKISGNTINGNDGGGVAAFNADFKMYGGTITGNAAGNMGGGVYVGNTNTNPILSGGSITDNTCGANDNGGGVGTYNCGAILFSGNVQITGNVKGGTITNGTLSGGVANNFYLPSGTYITITDELTGSARIGVTTKNTPGVGGVKYVTIVSSGSKESLQKLVTNGVLSYENKNEDGSPIGLFTKSNGYSTSLRACSHDFSQWAYSDTQHWKKCANCDAEDAVNKTDHSGGTATCTAEAVCTTCGQPYGDTDPNNHALVHHEAQAPTCTAVGWEAYDTCSRCTYTTYEEIPAAHTYGAVSYTWATDNTTCKAEHKCTACQHVENETVNTQQTVTQNRSCTLNELSTFTATFTNTAFAQQTKENVKTADMAPHTYSATEWKSNVDNHWHECAVCHTQIDKAEHNWKDATTSAPKTCTVCGATTGTKLSAYYYYSPAKTEDTPGSPKAGDPGVLLYAGLALASLTGLACTAKKRH